MGKIRPFQLKPSIVVRYSFLTQPTQEQATMQQPKYKAQLNPVWDASRQLQNRKLEQPRNINI